MNALNPDSLAQRKRRRRAVTRSMIIAALLTREQGAGLSARELQEKTGVPWNAIAQTLRSLFAEKLVERDTKREPYGAFEKARTKAVHYYWLRSEVQSAERAITLYRVERERRQKRVNQQIDEAREIFKRVIEDTDTGRAHRDSARASRAVNKARAQQQASHA